MLVANLRFFVCFFLCCCCFCFVLFFFFEGFRSSDVEVYPVEGLTCDSRPPVSDASGRWELCLYRFVCTPSKLAVVLSPRNSGSFSTLPVQTPTITQARYIVIGVRLETHIKPMFFSCDFFAICRFRFAMCPGMANLPHL